MEIIKCSKCSKETIKKSNSRQCTSCRSKYALILRAKKPEHFAAYHKQRVEKIRELIIKSKDFPCKDCGKKYHWYVMDFDHIIGKKSFSLSQSSVGGRSIETVKKEIAKCEVVCTNCHRMRTYNRKQANIGP